MYSPDWSDGGNVLEVAVQIQVASFRTQRHEHFWDTKSRSCRRGEFAPDKHARLLVGQLEHRQRSEDRLVEVVAENEFPSGSRSYQALAVERQLASGLGKLSEGCEAKITPKQGRDMHPPRGNPRCRDFFEAPSIPHRVYGQPALVAIDSVTDRESRRFRCWYHCDWHRKTRDESFEHRMVASRGSGHHAPTRADCCNR
jgi:hypothetical protein